MAITLFNKLVGYYRFTLSGEDPARLLNILHSRRIAVYSPVNGGDGSFTFDVLKKDFEIVREILDKNGFKRYSVYRAGLPRRLLKYRKRPGMIVGAVLFAAILYASSLFVWNVEAVTPGSADHEDIINGLKEIGFGVGTFLPKCDIDQVCFEYMSRTEDVSWIAINIKGTVAEIETRDIVRSERYDDSPSNLVASDDALIESYSVYGGISCVQPGQVVRRGELLVSGVIDDNQGRLRLCRASGEILGRVTLTLTESVPKTEKTAYTEESDIRAERLSILGRSVGISKKPDTKGLSALRRESSALVLFDSIELPITLERTVYGRKLEKTVSRTDEEARLLAAKRLAKQVSALEADIISMETNETDDGETLTLACRIECIKNIAEERKIGVSEDNNE
ncbi:MAG: sporulation protein YqfD [Clostridia bacterium]|nr:sporulation protein YqfD [Clostridia bacterium]